MINVGARKAKIINEIIRDRKPQVMVELGGYIGYSAISFGQSVRSVGGSKYFSLELDEKYARFAKSSLELAGLGDFVLVEIGISDTTLRRLHSTGQVKTIDILFIDHYKPAYENDLKVCEELGFIKKGTIIIADDVGLTKQQAPGYFKYIHSSVAEKKQAAEAAPAAHPNEKNWYLKDKPGEESKASIGNPALEYESKFVECLDSDGKEVNALRKGFTPQTDFKRTASRSQLALGRIRLVDVACTSTTYRTRTRPCTEDQTFVVKRTLNYM